MKDEESDKFANRKHRGLIFYMLFCLMIPLAAMGIEPRITLNLALAALLTGTFAAMMHW